MTQPLPPTLNYQSPPGAGWIAPLRFRSLHGLSITLIALINVSILISLIRVGLFYGQVVLIESIKAGTKVTAAQAHLNDLRIEIAYAIEVLFILAGVVVWLVWFHAAYANLPLFSRKQNQHTNGWAVGAYFVPILNLVRVPGMLIEAWKGSDPERPSSGGLVVIWWLAWIAAGIFAEVASAVMQPQPGLPADLDSLINGSWLLAGSEACRILAGILAIILVQGISSRQARGVAFVGQSPPPLPIAVPPPPPVR